MRLLATSESQAEEFADRAFLFLRETAPAYAANMERWATPQEDAGQWFIVVEPQVLGAFTADELTQLDPPIAI